MRWNTLQQTQQLEEIKEVSKDHAVVIFKHSTRCPVSSMALGRFESDWDDEKAGSLEPYYLDLIANRPVSNAIEAEFGVRHQSPQVIVVKDGKAIYNASHNSIDFDEVNKVKA